MALAIVGAGPSGLAAAKAAVRGESEVPKRRVPYCEVKRRVAIRDEVAYNVSSCGNFPARL